MGAGRGPAETGHGHQGGGRPGREPGRIGRPLAPEGQEAVRRTPMAKAKTTTNRTDAVFIRKSTQTQDEKGQADNVRAMLKAAGVYVPDAHWFAGTISRRKV